MTVVTSVGRTTGIKPKRSTSSYPTPSSVNDPFMDLNASFSYGSSDEEDANNATTLTSPKAVAGKLISKSLVGLTGESAYPSASTSKDTSKGKTNFGRSATVGTNKSIGKKFDHRKTKMITVSLNAYTINKEGRDSDDGLRSSLTSSSSSGSSRFLPLSQREKMKRATKIMQQRRANKQEPPVSPHLTLKDLVRRSDNDGKNLYRDSWRNRNKDNPDPSDESENEQHDIVQNETQQDVSSSQGLFECILSAFVSAGCGGSSSIESTELEKSRGNDKTCHFFGDDASYASTDVSGKDSSNASTASNSITDPPDTVIINNDRYATPISDEKAYLKTTSPPVTLESCIEALMSEKWNLLLRLITRNPSVLSKTSSIHRNKTLLHILSGLDANIPVMVLVTMINLCPESVSKTDRDGCIPLHHMVFAGGKDNLVKIMLESWADGCKVQNIDGDLPLHVSVWAGKGNENVADMLMDVYPQAVGKINNAEGTPLHLACCESNASPTIVENIIQMQLSMDVSFNTLDKNGNTPLHVAIKTKAPLGVIKVIHSELGSEPFCQADRSKVFPLQMALSMQNVDPAVVKFICTAAPRIMKKQMTNGMMPVLMAAKQGMPRGIIKELLLADSPIKFMPPMPSLKDVTLRIHSQSWWHMATSEGKYAPVIDEILSEMASIHEIVSLCQEPDFNGYSSMYERAHKDVKDALNKNLVFCDRYKVAPDYKATIIGGLLLLCAVDTIVEENQPTSNGITYAAASYPQPQQREVLLHCCVKGSEEYNQLVDEINARERFNFSHLHSQRLFKVHTASARKMGCSGDMLCLAFERPLLTLQEIFETSRFRKRKNQQWARKSLNLLLSLARVLKYFHSVGYIHGYVEPSTIGKFIGSNNWKMLDMRRATKMGKPMRGNIRYGAPPESVRISKEKGVIGEVKKMVSFDENFVRGDISKEKYEENETMAPLEFCPQKVVSDPTWDIWSFGLIMGQLVLGQSMVLMPNIEKATDAHLKNLHHYNDAAVNKIYDAARRVSGNEAATLLAKLLQPRPEDRPQSMDEVLSYDYFKTTTADI